WVEGRTCQEWCGGFLCVDGTAFNLSQKPGWHRQKFKLLSYCSSTLIFFCFLGQAYTF
ncbi:hypothetical protein P692DRAFT_201729402, partial [Suillus brevipes Sb2]